MSDQRRNLYFFYQQTEELNDKLESLFQLARDNDFQVVEDSNKANIIIAVGGDGTFLQAVRKTGFRQDCLYVGIRAGNEAGLYCDFDIDNHDEMIDAMKNSEIEVRRFPLIETTINNESTFSSLNECSVRSTLIKSIVVDVYIDDLHFETFRGDGLIIATPTGSTAYNKSINGAVVDPKLPCFQISELASLNNNRYRTLGSSFILSGERTLKLTVRQDGNDHPIIGMDNEAFSIRNIHDVTIKLSENVIKTVKLKNNTYWDRVKRTFL
ncbi:NAD+ kinase [Halobacillus karajensis]|uniref:NAD kinase n=1 Tax=Halobacillus karajensis TaxID=195088 RepID=A0A024P7E0_9BACI|nr:NAD kinase [Halobacillus karajensis]CDQ18309.1 putative inorganic polyphosphate/ATP-NAD kinase 1 [Halobacillus karajensis]CDQ24663.1 putative inorganic polyphosphate/ATP-NAD kinase 1 [Halobacillus karajensis]CDQ29091.1 putative inorganic polyphosphate/ATP-NAD kinase 1 [Halobacillus karajensis]SEI06329.1 NAD+ kinase [Halobacillus karajensis]